MITSEEHDVHASRYLFGCRTSICRTIQVKGNLSEQLPERVAGTLVEPQVLRVEAFAAGLVEESLDR